MLEDSVTYQKTLSRGELRGLHRAVLFTGRNKFGSVPAEVESSVRVLQDPERLERMLARMLTAATWEELLAVE